MHKSIYEAIEVLLADAEKEGQAPWRLIRLAVGRLMDHVEALERRCDDLSRREE